MENRIRHPHSISTQFNVWLCVMRYVVGGVDEHDFANRELMKKKKIEEMRTKIRWYLADQSRSMTWIPNIRLTTIEIILSQTAQMKWQLLISEEWDAWRLKIELRAKNISCWIQHKIRNSMVDGKFSLVGWSKEFSIWCSTVQRNHEKNTVRLKEKIGIETKFCMQFFFVEFSFFLQIWFSHVPLWGWEEKEEKYETDLRRDRVRRKKREKKRARFSIKRRRNIRERQCAKWKVKNKKVKRSRCSLPKKEESSVVQIFFFPFYIS